jgi:glycosyltransferase involved in cell wall biosynthesis
MKIATVSYYLPIGSRIGAGYQVHYLANAYARRGHEVTMFSPFAEKSDDALYENVQVPCGRHMRTFQFAWNLRQQDFTDFDLLHAGMDDYWLLGKRRPFHIRTFMGSCFAEALHIPGVLGKVRMTALGLSEWMACGVADIKVCISHNTRRYIPFARNVIWCGADLTAFAPGDECDKEAEPTILCVGTYHNRKRGKLLMDQFRDVILPAIPNARLWMVTTDAPEAENVTVWGRIPLDKLTELYRRAWVFCLPSSYEGFGVPYIEAMACGTAVVATPNVGACEVLERGKYGRIAAPEQLGGAIVELLRDDATRSRLRSSGLTRAREFGWDHIVDQYEQLYREAQAHRPSFARRLTRSAR